MTIELEREVGHRLEPCIGDRIVYDGPEPSDPASSDAWDRRRTRPSIVIDVAGGWCHSIELRSGSYEAWSGRRESVKVIGRALYTDTARERAVEHIELLAGNARLVGEVAMLREQAVESEYRRELAEAVAREMRDVMPARIYLPGDAEPARHEPAPNGYVVRNAVFALGAGFVYQQRHEDEWYAAHLSHSVFSWEQVLGDGPCVEVTNTAGVARLFDVLRDHRQNDVDLRSAVWELERLLDGKVREHGLDAPRDTEPPGTVLEARAVMSRAARVIYVLSSAARKAQP